VKTYSNSRYGTNSLGFLSRGGALRTTTSAVLPKQAESMARLTAYCTLVTVAVLVPVTVAVVVAGGAFTVCTTLTTDPEVATDEPAYA